LPLLGWSCAAASEFAYASMDDSDVVMAPVILIDAPVDIRVLSKVRQRVFDGVVLVVAATASVRLIVQWP
jgi:hypothetical protein